MSGGWRAASVRAAQGSHFSFNPAFLYNPLTYYLAFRLQFSLLGVLFTRPVLLHNNLESYLGWLIASYFR